MPNDSKKEQIKGLTIWTVILIVVAIIVVGIVALSYILPRKPKQEALPTPSTAETAPKPTEEMQEPDIILFCMGTLEAIDDDVIEIKAPKEQNQFLNDRSFKAKIDDQTKISSKRLSDIFTVTDGGQSEIILNNSITKATEEQILSISDLEIGDLVIAVSSENIKDKNYFIAKEVYYIR